MNDYMDMLRDKRQEVQAAERPNTLKEEIQAWWEVESAGAPAKVYNMEFFEYMWGPRANAIGPVLHSLGFTRRRSWKQGKSFSRYWIPPTKEKGGSL